MASKKHAAGMVSEAKTVPGHVKVVAAPGARRVTMGAPQSAAQAQPWAVSSPQVGLQAPRVGLRAPRVVSVTEKPPSPEQPVVVPPR